MTVSDGKQHVKIVPPTPSGDVLALPYKLLILLSEHSPAWFRDFHKTLVSALPTAHSIEREPNFQSAFTCQTPAAVLDAVPPCLTFFRSIPQQPGQRRPLCVSIAQDDILYDEAELAAELILAPTLRALKQQLRACLRLRADACAL